MAKQLVLMKGNQAIAEAAIRCGCDGYFGYPITPQSEVLEHFCHNMPSGYCNDDYYKGIVLSREGVYDSYLSIAREAEKRGNHEMARKFYQYAEEYKRKND